MRFVDEKLRVYSRVLTLQGELAAVELTATAAIKAAEQYDDVDVAGLQDPDERRAAQAAFDRAARESREAYELSAELVRLVDALRIWAPRPVTEAAAALRKAHLESSQAEVGRASELLVKAIRNDLMIGD
ncbi:hypothetical protein ACN26Y_11005 [Micromonospora sp. WMMD558]|uniref:hypothetical protein n=1 Tax=unclassified Micromonospora TaxID=2617518 RepID=UPI0012B487FE|nr:hypothetical protein [Micromonospora sp. WMMC415]QGN46775.1 hypothetical protein GKC29_07900 [Micromonospora sp. WMMC415]